MDNKVKCRGFFYVDIKKRTEWHHNRGESVSPMQQAGIVLECILVLYRCNVGK